MPDAQRNGEGRFDPRRLFYGWWIVGASMVVQVVLAGLLLQSSGLYMVALGDGFGWSRTMLSAGFALISVGAVGGLGPLQGWMVDRFGPRRVMRLGVVILALGFVAFSQVQSPVMFFAALALMAVGSSLAGFLSLTIAVVNWFERRRATALGLMQTGFPVGALLVPLIAWVISAAGWRPMAFVSGFVILAVAWPLSRLIRDRPESYGYGPDGRPLEPGGLSGTGNPRGPALEAAGNPGFSMRDAIRTPQFWYISIGHAAALLVVSAVMVHLVAHLNEGLGYSIEQASAVVVLVAMLQVTGMVGGGLLGDRMSKRVLVTGCMVGHMVAMLLLAHATVFLMVGAFALIHGISWGMRGPLLVALRADYFGRDSFGTIMGLSSAISVTGMIAGPVIAGVLHDVTESYAIGFTVLALLAGLGGLLFVAARPPGKPAAGIEMVERSA